jgi:transposase-like protein
MEKNPKDESIIGVMEEEIGIISEDSIICCRHCGCDHCVKFWKMNNKIRYKCKHCGRSFTLNDRRIKHDIKEIELALLLYNNNVSLRGIQSTLNSFFDKKIPFDVIKKWINNVSGRLEYYRTNREKEEIRKDEKEEIRRDENGKKNEKLKENKTKKRKEEEKEERQKKKQKIPILEMDELWSYYLDEKSRVKKNSKYGLLLIGTENKEQIMQACLQ